MPQLNFSGIVHPERAILSVSTVRSQILGPSGTQIATISLNIQNNQISAVVESDEPNVLTLRNIVRSEAEFLTNIAGFLFGFGYDVEITKVVGPELAPTYVFGIDIPVLANRAQGRDINVLVNAMAPLYFGVDAVFLRRFLSDLSIAIKRPDDTAFYCFRAIESLRHSFGPELSEAGQWKAMAQGVGSSKSEMEPLRAKAFPARHGIPPPVSDEERQALFLFTWKIVEGYIDFQLKKIGSEAIFGKATREAQP
jgi:hypothetical protein